MASRHGKRKIAKAKVGRANRATKMQEEEEFELDIVSPNAKLMGTGANPRRKSPLSFGLVISLFVGGCVLVIAFAGVLAWNLHLNTNVARNGHEDSHRDPLAPSELHKNDPAYGLSTNEVFNSHLASTLSREALRRVANAVHVQDLKTQDLNPLLITRVPGTTGSQMARDHIIGQINSLGGWDVEQHTVQMNTPQGPKNFTNIIVTVNPDVKRRLVLACHYDSKYFQRGEFIGATDSALPCAQLLYLASTLDQSLKQANATYPPVTLQLIFFDGEEAFQRWTSTDSLYGSRALVQKMKNTPHPVGTTQTTTQLDGMDMFILLDLLGARNPSFYDFFQSTSKWYDRMTTIEQRLKVAGLTAQHRNYFANGREWYDAGMQDDHIPFLREGVRILHLIPHPFPSVWHKMSDNAGALDDNTIANLSKIFHVFVAEYLTLQV